ncbi:MAG TPA: thiamine pyrophosphate-requiring protein [Hyphomicrobiaceae bacterium]|nr:thiamine pyrophosphate-requiring protein [Hyphomicrobiaceae bacterium]
MGLGKADLSAADVILASLRRHGVEFFFANPGTDFPPIVEGFARAKLSGAKVPRPILVPHENLAMAMAHGAYLMTDTPQAVMVHVNVGTANTINLLANAARDRVPLLLMAGRSPIMEKGTFGARSRPIHWAQEMFDQAGMVREFVKWDYELRNPIQAGAVVARALEVAMASPRGPVYLTLPREPLSAAGDGDSLEVPRQPPSSPHPDPALIDRLADWLLAAERPLLIVSSLGRRGEDVQQLGRIAERFAVPVVVHTPRFLCLPTDHPLHHGFDPHPLLADSDLIVVVEADVPWMPSRQGPAPAARVVHIGEDPAYLRYPMRSYPSHLSIAARAGAALKALSDALEQRAATDGGRLPQRLAWAVARAASLRRDAGRSLAAEAPHISPTYLSQCIGEVAGPDGLIFNEYQLRLEHCARTQPASYFALSPAGGLGWSVGAALGAKLAAPDRFVMAVIGDGGMIFANPTACHWVAEAHQLPIAVVIFNNARYGAVRNATMAMFASGAAGRENGTGLAELSPSPAFERYAEAHGAFAARVEHPAELASTLLAARNAVLKEQRHALVNVITPY